MVWFYSLHFLVVAQTCTRICILIVLVKFKKKKEYCILSSGKCRISCLCSLLKYRITCSYRTSLDTKWWRPSFINPQNGKMFKLFGIRKGLSSKNIWVSVVCCLLVHISTGKFDGFHYLPFLSRYSIISHHSFVHLWPFFGNFGRWCALRVFALEWQWQVNTTHELIHLIRGDILTLFIIGFQM